MSPRWPLYHMNGLVYNIQIRRYLDRNSTECLEKLPLLFFRVQSVLPRFRNLCFLSAVQKVLSGFTSVCLHGTWPTRVVSKSCSSFPSPKRFWGRSSSSPCRRPAVCSRDDGMMKQKRPRQSNNLNITLKYLLEIVSPIAGRCLIGTFTNPCSKSLWSMMIWKDLKCGRPCAAFASSLWSSSMRLGRVERTQLRGFGWWFQSWGVVLPKRIGHKFICDLGDHEVWPDGPDGSIGLCGIIMDYHNPLWHVWPMRPALCIVHRIMTHWKDSHPKRHGYSSARDGALKWGLFKGDCLQMAI